MTASHFIEHVRYDNGVIKSLSIASIKDLKKNLSVSEKFNINTTAVFKIYQRVKAYEFNDQISIVQ